MVSNCTHSNAHLRNGLLLMLWQKTHIKNLNKKRRIRERAREMMLILPFDIKCQCRTSCSFEYSIEIGCVFRFSGWMTQIERCYFNYAIARLVFFGLKCFEIEDSFLAVRNMRIMFKYTRFFCYLNNFSLIGREKWKRRAEQWPMILCSRFFVCVHLAVKELWHFVCMW